MPSLTKIQTFSAYLHSRLFEREKREIWWQTVPVYAMRILERILMG
jgi:hypothetical protein